MGETRVGDNGFLILQLIIIHILSQYSIFRQYQYINRLSASNESCVLLHRNSFLHTLHTGLCFSLGTGTPFSSAVRPKYTRTTVKIWVRIFNEYSERWSNSGGHQGHRSSVAEHWQFKPESLGSGSTTGSATFLLCPIALLSQRSRDNDNWDCVLISDHLYRSLDHKRVPAIRLLLVRFLLWSCLTQVYNCTQQSHASLYVLRTCNYTYICIIYTDQLMFIRTYFLDIPEGSPACSLPSPWTVWQCCRAHCTADHLQACRK